eukprot:scaffold199705_cov21-Tisochrysis_lutea.AAC.3
MIKRFATADGCVACPGMPLRTDGLTPLARGYQGLLVICLRSLKGSMETIVQDMQLQPNAARSPSMGTDEGMPIGSVLASRGSSAAGRMDK